jgi:D-lactate dehydrogenase
MHHAKNTAIAKLQTALARLDHLDSDAYLEISKILASTNNQPGFTEEGKLKIAMFDAKKYDLDAFNQQNRFDIVITPHETALSEQTAILAKGSKVVCIFVNDVCNEKVIEKLARYGVQLIALRCAGYNNVDIEACKKHNIDLVRVPAYSPHAVAEHSVALMLMLNRNLHRAYLRNRAGQFILDGLVGFNMFEKTVGVVGTGRIGQCVINILLGFGCKVLAYDIYPNQEIEKLASVTYTSLDDLFQHSDIVTLHAPLVAETYHCINEQSISKMKNGVMLINTSRGGLIDSKALIKGLKNKAISSAGLDVYEEEADIFFKDMSNTIIDDDVFARLLSFSNVVITSHQAFLTHEALSNIAETTLANINEYKEGKRGKSLSNIIT